MNAAGRVWLLLGTPIFGALIGNEAGGWVSIAVGAAVGIYAGNLMLLIQESLATRMETWLS